MMSESSFNYPTHEYSPNNNTNQNIDAYRSRMMAQNNMYNNSQMAREQVGYDNFQYNQNQTPYNLPEFLITPSQNMISSMYQPNNSDNINNNNSINIINNQNNINNKINDNNIINSNDNKIEDNNNKKKEQQNVIIDPDEILFKKDEEKKKDELQNEEEEPLSSESDKNSNNEKEFKDHLLAQYEKVKRVKNRWKVYLKGCVVQHDNKEYICGKINGDLEREW